MYLFRVSRTIAIVNAIPENEIIAALNVTYVQGDITRPAHKVAGL